MGVAALVRLVVAAGDRMSASVWVEAITTLHDCAADTRPVSWLTLAQHPQGASQELSLLVLCWCTEAASLTWAILIIWRCMLLL